MENIYNTIMLSENRRNEMDEDIRMEGSLRKCGLNRWHDIRKVVQKKWTKIAQNRYIC